MSPPLGGTSGHWGTRLASSSNPLSPGDAGRPDQLPVDHSDVRPPFRSSGSRRLDFANRSRDRASSSARRRLHTAIRSASRELRPLPRSAASWDTHQINLHLETWGSIEVLVPEGVAVQMVGGSGSVHLESLSAPVPSGPVLRISTSGPTGVIRIRHPRERNGGPFTRWRRRTTGSPSSGS